MEDAVIKQEGEGPIEDSIAGQICAPQTSAKVDPILSFYSKKIKEILTWDEHKIGLEELCARFGYRSEYLINVGVTNAYVKY